jgi:hypothetical protein
MTCECPPPESGARKFWCERHKTWKYTAWYGLCEKANYFQAWEEGRGPGQKPSTPPRPKAVDTLRAKRTTARKLACKECPDGHWDESRKVCPMFSGKPCAMEQYFKAARQVCRHWPE